ncbi:MAG: platelet-activating factor acetylhydrolase IB subunit [Pirellulales bacterium]
MKKTLLLHRCLVAFLLVQPALVFAQSNPENSTPATTTPVPRTGKWMQRHETINDRATSGDVDVIFLGDSITQGWERSGKDVWTKYFAPLNAMNAGIGGDRTQHVLWRLDHGNIKGISPKAAVLMIGTNNSGSDSSEQIAAGIRAIVEKIRSDLPKTKVLLLAIFPRGQSPDDTKRKVNEGANEMIKELDDGEYVFYLDIGPKFLTADGTLEKKIMPDLLHLSPEGYEIWATSILPKLHTLMNHP